MQGDARADIDLPGKRDWQSNQTNAYAMQLQRRVAHRGAVGLGAVGLNKMKPLFRIARRARNTGPVLAETAREFNQYLFICGLHRSGTSLLEGLLKAKFDLCTLAAAHVPENEGQHLQDVYAAASQFGGPGQFAFHPQMHPTPPEAEQATDIRNHILRCWTPWMVGNGIAFLEKSPPNLTRIAWLRAVFPGAKFIVLARDPRVVAAATRKWSDLSLPEMVFHWHVAYSAALQAWADDCLFLSYESLCADPDRELDRLGDAIGLRPRQDRQEIDERFANLSNTNQRYLDDIEEFRFGPGVWDQLGYKLD